MAIKVFRLDLPPERVHQLVAEFERLIAAGLAHPGIAAPLATGIDGVVAYLAQDYVAADSLDVIVRDGPRPPADTLRVASQLADSLDFAAAVNINHGALNPRDVLVSQDEIRMTGLGVSRALERVGVAPPVRRPYTAPERIAGAGWDRRADIFSLAALMHEMLWGRRVSGTGAQAADMLTELAGGDLAALREVFARALADDPVERFSTALAFADALKEAFAGASIAAPGRAGRQSAVRSRRSFEEPRLPLDDAAGQVFRPGQPDEMVHSAAAGEAQVFRPARLDEPVPMVQVLGPADADEAVRSATLVAQVFRPASLDEARYQDVDLAAAVAPSPTGPAAIALPEIARPPDGLMEPYPSQPVSAREQPRSEIWPLALALVVGLGLGFGGGYAVGIRDRSTPAPAAVATAPVASSGVGAQSDAAAETEVQLKPDTATRDATTGVAKSDRGVRLQPDPTAPGRLLIRSTPAGARVFVDGRDRGETPATVRDLERGAHLIRLVRDGYATQDRRVVITASRPAQSLTIALSRPSTLRNTQGRSERALLPPPPAAIGGDTGALTVDSRPSGANVFIDGKLAGTTPLNVSAIPVGDHTVWLQRDGYRRWTSPVRIGAAGQNKVTASLER